MVDDVKDLMSDGLSAPLGDVISAVGRGVAEAQAALDHASLTQTMAIYAAQGDPMLEKLRDIGYRPTFYVLPETMCEVQVSMRIGGSGGPDGSAGSGPSALPAQTRLYVTPVDAGFTNRYAYSAQASAKLSFKIVPVPPPAALDDTRPVPELNDLTVAEARARLAALGLRERVVDLNGQPITESDTSALRVKAQEPIATTLLSSGSPVTLRVAAS